MCLKELFLSLVSNHKNIFIVALEVFFLAGKTLQLGIKFQLRQGMLRLIQLLLHCNFVIIERRQFLILGNDGKNINVIQEKVIDQKDRKRKDVLVLERKQILFHSAKLGDFGFPFQW